MLGLNEFVRNRNPENPNNQQAAPHPDRPATAQSTRDLHERNGHHMYGTETDDFDATRSSLNDLNDQDYNGQDGFEDREEDDQYDDQAFPIHQGNGHLAGGLELDALMSQFHHNTARSGHAGEESYPPTTSGEPEPDEDFENEVDVEHAQAHSRVEQPLDIHNTKIPQRQFASTPLPIQSQPPRVQQCKDQFKVTTKPTISHKDVQQRQKKPQNKTHVVSQPSHIPEQFETTIQVATNHKSTARVPNLTHQQPARAQTTTANHRQRHTNGIDHHRQQYIRRVDYQEDHLDGLHNQQQHGMEESPEDNHEQSTHSDEVLDYELQELYAKDFAELQDEPFDGPPRGEVPDTQSDLSKPLSERLKAVAKLDVRHQKELFSSLKLEEWEEAGDWFQERFSEVFGKLKAARKKRRQMASGFEQQIAQRQQVLTKKRKITDDALTEMKKSGSLVLTSTPKKKQRITE
ncbi:hypothetical protein KCU85_g5527, partial [Aureobasidium melanogenum]